MNFFSSLGLPWLVFQLNHELYAINSARLVAIMALDKTMVTDLPHSRAELRGIVNFRGRMIPLLDLRVLYGIETQREAYENFCAMIEQRKKDHIAWLAALEESVKTGKPFTLAMDSNECAFGKWLNGFQSEATNINFQLKKIEIPHAQFHAIAREILREGIEERKAETLLQESKELLGNILAMLSETQEIFQQCFKEFLIAVEDGEKAFAVVVDDVIAVEAIEENTDVDEEMHGLTGKSSIMGVGRRLGQRQDEDKLVMLVDERALGQLVECEAKNMAEHAL